MVQVSVCLCVCVCVCVCISADPLSSSIWCSSSDLVRLLCPLNLLMFLRSISCYCSPIFRSRGVTDMGVDPSLSDPHPPL
ncbi:hypothetical protein B0T09DRAFT_67013 [Sordaria sp. MPI-SDFR-AT-0083]|nr:hypothetical protein B0T09DRAFT_67013 [Sordaria sp. MPI-SDFR-AT-0083]